MNNAKKICPNCSQLYHLKCLSPQKGNIPLFLSCGHSMCENCVKNFVKFVEPIECKVCHRDTEISPSDMALLSSLSPQKGNIPLFLSCGHSMCENCVKNFVKFVEPIECKVCHRDTEISPSDMALLSSNKIKLYQIFPVNYFMLGEITMQLLEQNDSTEKDDDDFFIDVRAIIKSTDRTQGDCIECHNVTTKMCKQCATILCDNCFNKTHKNFIVFKNHALQTIEPEIEPNNCKLHKEKTLEYFCKDCLKSVCMDCMMVGGEKSCKNHNVVSMQEVNDEFMEDINEISPQVDIVFKRLTKTAVDIGNLLHNIENDTGTSRELTGIVSDIEQHFSKLCSIIQKHKKEVLDIIIKLKQSEKESLKKAKIDVAASIKNTKVILNTINALTDPNKIKQINLSVLFEEAKHAVDIPWYLSRDETKKDPLKVAVSEDLCTLISDYIHLEGNADSTYNLRSTKDLGDDVEIPPPPTGPVYPPELPKDVRQFNKPKVEKNVKPMFHKDAPTYRSKSGSNCSLNSIQSDTSAHNVAISYLDKNKPLVQPVSPFEESQQPKQILEGTQELIYISHIVDPHNFFVQRSCHQRLVKTMLRDFRNAISLPKPSICHVTEGKLYLAFNQADNMWQRCRVVSIDRKDINNPVYNVFCIDFGSNEHVTVDKLRLLPAARMQSPLPLAINCSLANCEPKRGNWTADDSFLIQKIIDNKQAVIHVRHIRSASNYNVTLECDVTTIEDGVSLAHALVFHDRAKMPNQKLPYPKIIGLIERPKLYMNNDFKYKAIEEVYLTYIVSPDKFFVRKRHLQGVYEKLCEDLDSELSATSGVIYLPEIGMVCAVNLEKYRSQVNIECGWARGIVREMPGRGRVRVSLVDTGSTVIVHWTALCHLPVKLTTLRALATECHLAGVTPVHKKWSPNSVALLQQFENRLLELHVEDNRNKDSIGVSLFDKNDEDNEICINNEMIRRKFAICFGIYSFTRNTEENPVFPNVTPLDNPKKNPKTKHDKITVLKKKTKPENVNDSDLDAKDKGPLRLEAKVLSCQSPSLFYIILLHQQKAFNELFEEMQKYYSKNKVVKKDWEEGDRCCAFCNQSKTWRRAVILEVNGDNAKVFYSDFAFVETVQLSGIMELTKEFGQIGDAAIKCHLHGVIPAVGEEWPSISKEYLKELLDIYKRVFITKLGNFKNKSMPVELWVYHTDPGSALEPNKSEWRCLNKKIIEQGLGVPDKLQETTENKDNADDMLSFLNLEGPIEDFLQLEPLPTKPLVVKSPETSTNASTPVNMDDVDLIEACGSNTVFISDWLPPESLPCKEFTAVPTYIDNDGLIYLHDINQKDTLDLIRKALDVRFKDPDPKAKFAKWTVGEPCIALYYLDNRFYRGKILEVNIETSSCMVHYIDYGNEEICSFENLRKSIALYQIPIQAHKCVLSGIRPAEGNTWDRKILDYIHKSIVEKQCFVTVVGEPISDVMPIKLRYDKLNINDHLVDFEMAVYTDGSKGIVRKFAPKKSKQEVVEVVIESDSGPDYVVEDETNDKLSVSQDSFDFKSKDWIQLMDEEKEESNTENSFSYPKQPDDEFICNITVINDYKVLDLAVQLDDETSALYEQMFEEINTDGPKMKPLNGIYENKACIALFSEDGQWYRATILEHSKAKNQIKVRYVDYGNIEVVNLIDARETIDEWTKLPPANVPALLYGVEINPDILINDITKAYAETFLDKGPFNVKIIKYENSLPCVELRQNGDLVYEGLIKNGIFLKVLVD